MPCAGAAHAPTTVSTAPRSARSHILFVSDRVFEGFCAIAHTPRG